MIKMNNSQKENAVSVFLVFSGVLLLAIGIYLLKEGINRVSFQMIGSSFCLWAFAASPKVMFSRVTDTSKFSYSKLSKKFFFIGALALLASLVIHFYKDA